MHSSRRRNHACHHDASHLADAAIHWYLDNVRNAMNTQVLSSVCCSHWLVHASFLMPQQPAEQFVKSYYRQLQVS
jgi:hypothetical protein